MEYACVGGGEGAPEMIELGVQGQGGEGDGVHAGAT